MGLLLKSTDSLWPRHPLGSLCDSPNKARRFLSQNATCSCRPAGQGASLDLGKPYHCCTNASYREKRTPDPSHPAQESDPWRQQGSFTQLLTQVASLDSFISWCQGFVVGLSKGTELTEWIYITEHSKRRFIILAFRMPSGKSDDACFPPGRLSIPWLSHHKAGHHSQSKEFLESCWSSICAGIPKRK